MSAVGIPTYEPKKLNTESYVMAMHRDGLSNFLSISATRPGSPPRRRQPDWQREFGVETGPIRISEIAFGLRPAQGWDARTKNYAASVKQSTCPELPA